MIDFRELVKAGVHFGHQKTKWCPKMAPYIWGFKNGVHLIDVSKTASQLQKAAKFLEGIAAQGKTILWVGTKKPARDAVIKAATDLKMPYVSHRWIGGTLSNNEQVKKSVTKLLHYRDIIDRAEQFPQYTKKEFSVFQKNVERLEKNIGGIQDLKWPVGAVVMVDVRKERSALKEASIMGIPVIGLVDTNSDPSLVDYVIPANDDSPRSINILVEHLSQSVTAGVEQAKKAKEKEKAEKAAQKEAAAKSAPAKKTAVKKDAPKKVTSKAKGESATKAPSAKKENKAESIEKNDTVKSA